MKILDVMPRSQIAIYGRFEETCFLCLETGKWILDNTVSHPRLR